MAFELFTSSRTSEPFISLVKDGFRFSGGFLHAYHLERATAVRLYFDRVKRAIGFHFPTGSHPAEGAVRLKRHDGGLVVHAQGFFKSREIDPAKYAGRYRPQEVKDRVLKQFFVIQLRTSTTSARPDSKGHRG